ncbi:BCCT family transporter [Vibrio caribbeanicus]|uniref:BCCT family transporter n=1 Tax=Vibrio caribbeanicus TaxID=701175 RepID=UPI0030DB8B9B
MNVSLKSRPSSVLSTSVIKALIISSLLVLFVFFPYDSVKYIAKLTHYLIDQLGWGLLLFSSCMVILVLGIGLSPLGKLRLGGQESTEEFSTINWLAMLFTAGMGSGLIFWGIAEPVFHAYNLPEFAKNHDNSLDTALALTYFHWGIHAWSIYAISGLVIAWFSYNRGRDLKISSFGLRRFPIFRGVLDHVAIVAILFGVAGTFANSIALIQTGIEHTFSVSIDSVTFRYSLMMLISMLFTVSSLLGLRRGIRILSLLNIGIMVLMAFLVFILLDPLQTLSRMVSSSMSYLTLLPKMSFTIDSQSRDWSLSWSIIYLVWWVAWAPFVGPFIAKISRGRSIRQFLVCVVMVPTIASIFWFSIFGGAALEQDFAIQASEVVGKDYTKGLFFFFENLPLSTYFSIFALLLLITFIITSADSALLVCGLLSNSNNGKSKIIWAGVLVTLSTSLLYTNDVDLNKQVAIAGALPFTLVIIIQAFFLLKDMAKKLKDEK